jgi:type IV pilus assembly protein PilB
VFDVGFSLGPSQEEAILSVLRCHHPKYGDFSDDEIMKRSPKDETLAAWAEHEQISYLPNASGLANKVLVERFDLTALQRGRCVPLIDFQGTLYIGASDPNNIVGIDHCRQRCPNHSVAIYLVSVTEVGRVLESLSLDMGPTQEELETLDEVGSSGSEGATYDISTQHEDPTHKMVQSILQQAIRENASDVHFHLEGDEFYFKLRIDGDRTRPYPIESKLRSRLDSILLNISGLSTENKKEPCDGRFTIVNVGRKIDVRYARHPTASGYHVTCRLLDKSSFTPTLGTGSLAFDEDSLIWLRRVMALPSGIIVMSGPTGSGKSTTLNAMLREVNRDSTCILTLENPVEEEIRGIAHCNLRDDKDFGPYWKVFLRSDPDTVLIGEVRDLTTAEAAVTAALTGHKVYTTLHTQSAAEIIVRLKDLGVDTYKITGALKAACAQRLVKLLCPACKQQGKLSDRQMELYKLDPQWRERDVWIKGSDSAVEHCPHCSGRGYKGRTAVLEILPMMPEIGAKICSSGEIDAYSIERAVREKFPSLPSLRTSGLNLVTTGITDVESVASQIDLVFGEK